MKSLDKFSIRYILKKQKKTVETDSDSSFSDTYILNNNNLLSVANNPISNIDIDVIMENLKISSIKELLECIEKTHLKEKEVFFNLLNEKFLDSLNPVF